MRLAPPPHAPLHAMLMDEAAAPQDGFCLADELAAAGIVLRRVAAPIPGDPTPIILRHGVPAPALVDARAAGVPVMRVATAPLGPLSGDAVDVLASADLVVLLTTAEDWRRLTVLGRVAGLGTGVLLAPAAGPGRSAFWRAAVAALQGGPRPDAVAVACAPEAMDFWVRLARFAPCFHDPVADWLRFCQTTDAAIVETAATPTEDEAQWRAGPHHGAAASVLLQSDAKANLRVILAPGGGVTPKALDIVCSRQNPRDRHPKLSGSPGL